MSLLEKLDVYDDTDPHPAALNMAIDETLFQTVETPTLRFYHWLRPSISFGYFGAYAEVSSHESDHDIVRRWTGGGVVFHHGDVTYSLLLPSSHPYSRRSSRQVYSDVHEAIARALRVSGLAATLATEDARKVSDACFANPVRMDVMVDRTKVAGAAQRRSRGGLMQQGSVQLEQMPNNFRTDFARALSDRFVSKIMDAGLIAQAEELRSQKYGSAGWLKRR